MPHWEGRYGDAARPHHPLHQSLDDHVNLVSIERSLFHLYRSNDYEASFSELIDIFGRKYPLIAYLFFLKDKSRFLPIAPMYFDRSFEYLGVPLKTNRRCSWENYNAYLAVLADLRDMLSDDLGVEVYLLDAHSFAWMLSAQMARANKLADVDDYISGPASEREAIVKARIGQGPFRQRLIRYWSECAVTGCREVSLLVASHIKPWSKSSLPERTDLYNGLLLSPSLDAAFDAGYITFDSSGSIMISDLLSVEDADALGIYARMRLCRVEAKHEEYLKYHREQVFKNGE